MFGRKERSPTPLRANYDFTLRHERAKMFLRVLKQCDGHAMRTAQAVRDLMTAFSQVSQSYYEVALCVNCVNPSTASILQVGRAPSEGGPDPSPETAVHEAGTLATPAAGGRLRSFDQRKGLLVARRGREGDISYQDGVAATYGAGLQTAAKLFASEMRSLKEGKPFEEFSEGVHKEVLGRLKEVETMAKQTVDCGDETDKLLKKLARAQRIVTLKERKYERLGEPLSKSKRYTKQVAAMRKAEELYTAKLACFDERYEHLFQRDLYVAGHTLDRLLDTNFTFLAHVMQVVGSLAPSAPDVVERVVVRGGEALGQRMGVAEADLIGSRIKGGRTGNAPHGVGNAAAGRRARAEATSSHNFTNYYSTRRVIFSPAAKDGTLVKGLDGMSSEVEAPPTAKNLEEAGTANHPNCLSDSPQRPTPAADLATPKKDCCNSVGTASPNKLESTPPPAPPASTAAAAAAAAPKESKALGVSHEEEEEPEPLSPPPPQRQWKALANPPRTTPERERSNAPFGDTPSLLNRAEQARLQGQRKQQQGGRDANAVASAGGAAGRERSPVPIVKRNPSLSPSREPYGCEEELHEETGMYSSLQRDRGSKAKEGSPEVRRCLLPSAATATPSVSHALSIAAQSNNNNHHHHSDPRRTNPRAALTVAPGTAAGAKAGARGKAVQPQPQGPKGARASTATVGPADSLGRKHLLAPRTSFGAAAATTPAATPAAAIAKTPPPVTSAPPAEDSDSDEAAISSRSVSLDESRGKTKSGQHHNATRTMSLSSDARGDHSGTAKLPALGIASFTESPRDCCPAPNRNPSGKAGSLSGSCLSASPSGAAFCLLPSPANADAVTNGRPTVAAVPGAFKGMGMGSGSNGSVTSFGLEESGGGGGGFSAGITPQLHNISGTSTPPPPPPPPRLEGRQRQPAPFYSATWEDMNLTKECDRR